MSFLETILAHKRVEVAERKHALPLAVLRRLPAYRRSPYSLSHALTGKPMALIAEVKRASPSQDVIRQDFRPVVLAPELAAAGASALSVLTDTKFFQGDLSIIREIRPLVNIPILRKDFIIDRYQVHEAKAAGADAVLLILSALQREQVAVLLDCAESLGLEALVELHSPEDLAKLPSPPPRLIGINNRDLGTFVVDPTTTLRLKKLLPPGCTVVSESGIKGPADLLELVRHDVHAALVGEMLMRAERPGDALRNLLAGLENV